MHCGLEEDLQLGHLRVHMPDEEAYPLKGFCDSSPKAKDIYCELHGVAEVVDALDEMASLVLILRYIYIYIVSNLQVRYSYSMLATYTELNKKIGKMYRGGIPCY